MADSLGSKAVSTGSWTSHHILGSILGPLAALAALAALALGYFLRGFIIFILSVKALQIFTVAACQSSSIEHAAHVTGMLQVRMLKFLETKAAEA